MSKVSRVGRRSPLSMRNMDDLERRLQEYTEAIQCRNRSSNSDSADWESISNDVHLAVCDGSHVRYLPNLVRMREVASPTDIERARVELLLGSIAQRTGKALDANFYLKDCIETCKIQNERGDPSAREVTLEATARRWRMLSLDFSKSSAEIAQALQKADDQIQLLTDIDRKGEMQASTDWRRALWDHDAYRGDPGHNYFLSRHKEYAESGVSLDELANHHSILSIMDFISKRPWQDIEPNSQFAFDYCAQLKEWTSVANVLCLQGLAELGADVFRPGVYVKLLLSRALMPLLNMTELSEGMAEILRFGKEANPRGIFFFKTAYPLLIKGWPDKPWITNTNEQRFESHFHNDPIAIQEAWEWVQQVIADASAKGDYSVIVDQLANFGLIPSTSNFGQDFVTGNEMTLSSLTSGPKVDNRFNLTRRETEVGRLLAEGKSIEEIALELFISERTVEWHLENIRGKLGVGQSMAAALMLKDIFR